MAFIAIAIAIAAVSLAMGNIAEIASKPAHKRSNSIYVYYLYRPHVKEYFGRNTRLEQIA